MKVVITSKNMNANDRLKDTIEKKMEKLSKYFSDNIIVNVTLSAEKNRQKIEATIRVRGMIFRAEDVSGVVGQSGLRLALAAGRSAGQGRGPGGSEDSDACRLP